MTVYGYTIGFNYDNDSHEVTIFVNETDTEKRVHSMTINNVDNQLKAFLHYTEYCDYLTHYQYTSDGEYWFLDAIGVLGPVDNSYTLPVPDRKVI